MPGEDTYQYSRHMNVCKEPTLKNDTMVTVLGFDGGKTGNAYRIDGTTPPTLSEDLRSVGRHTRERKFMYSPVLIVYMINILSNESVLPCDADSARGPRVNNLKSYDLKPVRLL